MMLTQTTDYKKKLLFYFFFISQTEAEVEYFTKNKLLDSFNQYLTSFESGSIGKKTLFDFFSENGSEIRVVKVNGKKLILTDLGVKKGFELEGKIEKHHINLIMEFFDLDIELNLYEDLEKDSIIYPIPSINESFGIKNFYWFYRGNDFTRKYKRFYLNFLTVPWQKTFGLVYGPSNSGKTSFLHFLTALNKRRVIKNSWVEKNKDIFDFEKTRIEYQNKITDLSELDSWLSDIRWKIQKQSLKDSKDKKESKISIKTSFINLADLNFILGQKGEKLLLILDQAEFLLEDVVKDKRKAKILVDEFLCEFSDLENIALILSISNEFYSILKTVLDKTDRLDIKFEEFLINELELDLIDIIIQEIKRSPVTKRKLYFKPILIQDNQIELIKKAVRHGNSFIGTELMIILNYLILNYGKAKNTVIIIPELPQETYQNILQRWMIEKIEERIEASPNTVKWWDYSLLKELLTISQNLAAPCPLMKIKEWYNYQTQLFSTKNIPSLERIARNLADDGLVENDEKSIQFKHQYVLTTFKSHLDKSDLILVNIKTLWDAEAELTTIPRLGPFKDAFEHINSLPHLLYEEKNREKLAYGLIYHHLDVDISIPSQDALDKIVIEILKRVTDFELEHLLSLFKNLNEKREQFFTQYKRNEPRTWNLFGENWISILDSEFNPNVLSNVIKEVSLSDSSLADNLSQKIGNISQENFLNLFSENIRVFNLLNNLSSFQPFLIEVIPQYQWEKAQEIDNETLKGILQNISLIIKQIIEDYSRGKEKHQIFNSDEEKLVQQSFVYNFFIALSEHIQWGKLNWNKLQIDEFNHFLSLFGRFLEFPKEIMNYDWSTYLENSWSKNPDKVLILLSKRYNFTSNYMVDWLDEQKFPRLEDFINCNKLGLLNYFLRRILSWNIRDKGKMFDFLNQPEFLKDNLFPLIENAYYPVLHDFQKILNENHPKKLTEFKELIEHPTEKEKYLNRYHRSLTQIFRTFPNHPIIDTHEFINNTASLGKEYSWYWPFLTLPSIFDLVLIIEGINPEQEKEFVNQIIDSIKRNPESWNNIFNVEHYIQSFEDFYPGKKENKYLREEERISTGRREPTIEEVCILHYLGLTLFFYRISESKSLQPILELLVDKTLIIQNVFDENYIRKIPWKKTLPFSRQLFDFGLYFCFSRNKIDMHKLENLIRYALNYTPIDAFNFLLNSENPAVYSIKDRIDHFSLTSLMIDTWEIRRKNPKKFSQILIQIMNGKRSDFSELDKLWVQLFGLSKATHPISNLGIDFTTLEALIDHPEKENILEQTHWVLYLPKMTDNELKLFFELSNTHLFNKGFNNIIIDSFIKGILEVFPKWYQIACNKWLNKLVSITNLIYFAKRIDHQKDGQLFINKISQELDSEDWFLLILNNLEDEEPVSEIMNFLETADEYPRLTHFQQSLVEILISDKKIISTYFKTFADAIVLLDWILEKYSGKNGDLSNIRQFLRFLDFNPLSLEPAGFHGRLGAIKIPLQSKSIRKPEVMKALIGMDFFTQMKKYIVKQINTDDYFFTYLPEIYDDMCNLQGKRKGKEIMKNILETIYLDKLFIEQRYFYRFDLKGLARANEDFIKILVETESFSNIDWTTIGNHKSWFDYYSFIEFLDKSSELLIRSIIKNPSFWRIKWLDFIKSWLLNCDKRVLNYFKFLDRFSDEKNVNEFLYSSELLKCPWENCKLKISQSKKESSLLSNKEFKELIQILEMHNLGFNRVIR